jgi:hypothetical protein
MKIQLTLTTLACLTTLSFADDTISPQIVYQVGKTYHQTMTMKQDITTPGGAMHIEMLTDMSMKVTDGEAKGTKEVKLHYDTMKLKSAMGGREMLNFDSTDKAAADSKTDSIGKMVGKEISLSMDPSNKITAVKGMEALSDNPMVKQMFNSDSMKELMGQNTLINAPEKVSKGESWSFSKSVPNPMLSISTKGKYTYKSDVEEEGHKLAVFDVAAQLSTGDAVEEKDDKEKDKNPQAAQMKQMMKAMGIKLTDGGMKGASYYDPELKFIRHAEFDTSMVMAMKSPQNGEAIEMPTKQTISIKLVGIEDTK